MRVLIIDDERSIRTSTAVAVQAAGHSADTSDSGKIALIKLHEDAYELAFLDLRLGDEDGLEVLGQIKRYFPKLPVVVFTAYASVASAVAAMQRGAFDYLEKPLTLYAVLAIIKRAIEHRERRHRVDVQEPVPSQAAVFPPDASQHSLTGCEKAYSIPAPSTHDWWRGTAPEQAFHHLRQRTLRRSVVLYGQGLQSGLKTGMILSPMPPHSGILFRNITTGYTMPASVDCIESTDFCTSLKQGYLTARTVEHLMSALHAYRITNVLIKISDEVPIMDGSADAFCHLIEEAGIAEQDAVMEEFIVDRCYAVGQVRTDAKFILVEPYDGFRVTYRLDYPLPLGVQEFSYEHTDSTSYRREIAPARTFGFVREVEKMQELGLIPGGRLTNVVLIGEEKIINSTPLRFPDECVRHKILDIIGDFYLLGRMVRGHVHANMTGHTENVALVKQLRAVMPYPRGY